ncbi:MAG: acyltransferase domain-containing protein, partial [Anaerolineales bacterium]|nr:acyltransferase domain-containing protein [Anaerolineales bacterium]
MTESSEVSQLKRALVALKEMRGRLDAAEKARTEPIAIIGIGCRFPGGANSPESFWQLLQEGVDAVTEVPPARWNADALYSADPETPGKTNTRFGAFLQDVDQFDPFFFGISPHEAAFMDPQQRLLLQVAWEALENAGQTRQRLAGSDTAVFVGVHSHSQDYYLMQMANPERLAAYTGTGTAHNVLSGRLSYLFDWQGPSMVVDTACSSSLVALHEACQSLRLGECGMALAGGVNLILSPQFSIAAAKMHMLAPDGRCKAFDARADGFGRGEGCGVVVLKRLSDAQADGDPIWAVIRGSAVNQDGNTNGLTAPNGLSQQRVIRQALANARVQPEQISVVETHGTGTVLGDPIEIEALATIMGDSPDRQTPCYLGSVKTNVAHLEGAAGIAGVIKAALTLYHRQVPAVVHFQKLNPHLALPNSFIIPTALTPLPNRPEPHLAGVSSFGWSGTNAHVILQEAPGAEAAFPAGQEDEDRFYPLILSAHTPHALRETAVSHQQFLRTSDASLHDIAYTSAVRRTHHEHRLVVIGSTRAALIDQLDAFLKGESRPGFTTGRVSAGASGLVFVFPGQGAQWLGMGRDLLQTEPVFRQAIEQCDAAIRPYVDWSLTAELSADPATSRLEEIDVVQPVLFAIQVALAALWRAWGIEPDAVIGHSMGEVAAAHVAGALSLDDAACIICQRSKLLRSVSGQGAMAVVGLSMAETAVRLKGYEDRLSIAVSNSPRSTVVSGDPAAVEQLLFVLAAEEVFCRAIKVDVASHSPQMDPLQADLESLLKDIRPRAAEIPIYSTVYGSTVAGESLNAGYWMKNLRRPVLFTDTLQRLIQLDHLTFVEISPHPVLLPAVAETLEHVGQEGLTVHSLRRDEPADEQLLAALGALVAAGYTPDWSNFYPAAGRFVRLPGVPWQQERYWLDFADDGQTAVGPRQARRESHPLLGWRLETAVPDTYIWQVTVNVHTHPYLFDHRLQGKPVVAASAYLEMGLAALKAVYGERPLRLANVAFQQPCFLPEDGSDLRLQITLTTGADQSSLQIHSRAGENWLRHISAEPSLPVQEDAAALSDPGAETRLAGPSFPRTQFYGALRDMGVVIGDQLQGVEAVWQQENLVLARLDSPALAEGKAFLLRPALLDSCLQLTAVAIPDMLHNPAAPYLLDQITYVPGVEPAAWARLALTGTAEDVFTHQLQLLGDEGQPAVEMTGLHLKRLGAASAGGDPGDWLYEVQWPLFEAGSVSATVTPETWVILAADAALADALAAEMAENGRQSIIVTLAEQFARLDETHYTVALDDTAVTLLLADLQARHVASCHFVLCTAVGTEETAVLSPQRLADAQRVGTELALSLVKAVAEMEWFQISRLWLVTQGVHSLQGEPVTGLAQSPLWGLGRVVAAEYPQNWGGLVDLQPDAHLPEQAKVLCQALYQSAEDQLAVRNGRLYKARLAKQPAAHGGSPAIWRRDSSYLITGGLGDIGFAVASRLAQQGVQRFVLVGRTPLPPRHTWQDEGHVPAVRLRIERIRALEALGTAVHYTAVDIADEGQLRDFLQSYRQEGWPPIRGVLHTAAVIDDRLLQNLDHHSLLQVLRPKMIGGWLLHKLLPDLDVFVLFSSLGSLWGQPGQGNYAAANAFLDALAHYRHTQGLPALSINWGAWTGLGFANTEGGQRTVQELARQGIYGISPEQGVGAMLYALAAGQPQTAVFPIDWQQYRQTSTGSSPRLFADIMQQTGPVDVDESSAVEQRPTMRKQLFALAAEQRLELFSAYLQKQIADILK